MNPRDMARRGIQVMRDNSEDYDLSILRPRNEDLSGLAVAIGAVYDAYGASEKAAVVAKEARVAAYLLGRRDATRAGSAFDDILSGDV